MYPVETPFKVYTGLDGKPLDRGYVYFGAANQNPITSPVTVYWDAAGTQPAAQPLRTENGYIMRAGTPANVFFDGAYSELVQDNKKRQVFYARTSVDFSIATALLAFIALLASSVGTSLVGFIQAGIGAILRTTQDKLREVVSVTDFGAVGDGVTDDILPIEKAIAALVLRGGGDCEFPYPAVKYAISRGIKVPSNIRLIGKGARPIIHNTGNNHATFDEAAVVINAGWYTTGNVNIHIENLTLRNRYQEFLSPVATSELGSRYGVFFGGAVGFSIKNCHVLDCPAESIYIGGIAGVGGLCSDGTISGNTCENSFASGIAITNGQRIRVEGNSIINSNIFGIDVEPNTSCVGVDITIANNVIDGVQATYYKNTIASGKSNGIGISLSTGSLADQVSNVAVTGNTVKNVKRWTTAAIVDFGSITLVGVDNCPISGNTLTTGESSGIVVRSSSKGCSITGNTIRNMYYNGITVSLATDCVVAGNTLASVTAIGISVLALASNTTVAGNSVKDTTGPGVYFQNTSKFSATGNIIRDTRAGGARLMTYGIHVSSLCADAAVTGNTISNTTSDPTRDVDGSTNIVMGPNVEDTAWRMRSTNFHLYSDGKLYKVGSMVPTAQTAASTSNGSIFVDSADSRLKYKDAAAAVNQLYFISQTAASAANSSLFIDSADAKLKFKDAAGVTNVLY